MAPEPRRTAPLRRAPDGRRRVRGVGGVPLGGPLRGPEARAPRGPPAASASGISLPSESGSSRVRTPSPPLTTSSRRTSVTSSPARFATRRSAMATERCWATRPCSGWARVACGPSRPVTATASISGPRRAGSTSPIESITDELACLQVQGPGAREFLRPFLPDIAHLPYFRFWPEPVPLAGRSCWVARIGYSGELGYELFCRSTESEGLWDALLASGGIPYGLAATETLRIEAGLILIGRDYLPHRSSPYDVSLDRLVRLEKGRFLGQEALRAIAASPPRRLVTILVEGTADTIPPAGTPIHEGGRHGRHGDELVLEPHLRRRPRPRRCGTLHGGGGKPRAASGPGRRSLRDDEDGPDA